MGEENGRHIGPLLSTGGPGLGPILLWPSSLALWSAQNVEISSYLIVSAELDEQFLSFLSGVREAWERSPICGSVMQQFLGCHLEAADQFLCHQLLL